LRFLVPTTVARFLHWLTVAGAVLVVLLHFAKTGTSEPTEMNTMGK
jgi:hypothetical protein